MRTCQVVLRERVDSSGVSVRRLMLLVVGHVSTVLCGAAVPVTSSIHVSQHISRFLQTGEKK
jgi:hypothetical protein